MPSPARTSLLLLAMLASGGEILAQPSDPQNASPFPRAEAADEARPGKYQVGPLYLTPRLRVGPIAYDSNVFYSSSDYQQDVMISVGPGLDAVWPFATGRRFYANGAFDYLYFVRTASQRQWVGSAAGGLRMRGSRTELLVEEFYRETFGHPNYEVDTRVEQTTEGTRLELDRRLFGRIGLALRGARQVATTSSTDDYFGTSFANALTENLYLGSAEVSYAISPKTSAVVRAEYQWARYPLDPQRDGDRGLLGGGLRTDRSALISGRALVGRRRYKSLALGERRELTWVDVDATWNVSTRTRLGGGYTQDLVDSFFIPEDGVPTQVQKIGVVRLEKQLTSRLDARLFARQTRYSTESPITLEDPDGSTQVEKRDDRNRELGLDLGYRFRPNFRFGIVATYRTRDSPFSSFNVDGLLVGFNAQLNPDLPWTN